MSLDLIRPLLRVVRGTLLTCLVSTGPLACGEPLAPSGSYRGEALFRVQGSAASSPSSETWHELKPVLAFVTDKQLQFDDSIMVRPLDDSGISGDFQLELFDAPPDEAMIAFEGHPEWGGIGLALIAAVKKDHPERVDRLRKATSSDVCSDDYPCACTDAESRRTVDYTFRDQSYQEVLCCPDVDSADHTCQIVSQMGDAELKEQPRLPVDAVVQNFVLFYIEQPAPAGSELAEYLFHSTEGLDAGYHLIEATPGEQSDEYDFKVVETEDVALRFQRDVLPWGVNL